MGTFSTSKKNIWKGLLYAVLPILCMAMLFTACEAETDESLVLFEEGAYKYKLVYSLQRADWEDTAIVKLYDGLEDLCGVEPELIADSELADAKGSKEILVGSTNREESRLPETLSEKDCYWSVAVSEDKVVINGSNEYAIGLAADYFLNQWTEESAAGAFVMSAEWTKEVTMKDYYREGWLLKDIPAYQGDNILATNLYQCGTYLTQYGTKDAVNIVMQSVQETTAEEAAGYAEIMKTNGYTEESHTSIENNQFYRFVKDDQRVYVNFYGNESRATIELDETGNPSAALGSYTYEPKAGEETEYYMFGIKMDPYGYSPSQEENTSGYLDNGACLVVKLADNSVIIIDGGAAQQMETEDADRLYNFLLQITDTPEGGVIRVAAWYITHFDSDHTCGFSAVLSANPERYDLQRLVCNLPDLTVTSKTTYDAITSPGAVLKHYPNLQEIRLRTGDVLQLADVTITTFFSHADFADEAGKYNTTNFNSTSVVAMFTSAAGMKMLVTGDSIAKSEAIYCNNFSTNSFKCDIMQQPHHNWTDISILYEYADAQVMLFTQSKGGLTSQPTRKVAFELAEQWCSEWYCGGTETVGFRWANGKAELIYQQQDIYN